MFKIYLKHLQIFNEQQQPIYYDGVNPNSLQIFNGLVSENQWIDFTNDVENLEKLDLSWRLKEEGSSGKGASNIDVGSSGEMTFTNGAYKFIMFWLNEHVASPLNGVEVLLKTESGDFRDFVIKNDGLTYCDDDVCTVDLSMRQKDNQYSCIQRTLIEDNHNGMFSGSYEHPRFSYCNELRPAGILTALFSLVSIVGFIALVMLLPIKIIVWVLIGVLWLIDWTSRKLKKWRRELESLETQLNYGNIQDAFVNILVDISGCGREHPAPLVRDYISNVCNKCGINVTKKSIPIFFDESSDYYNLTMLTAGTKKGIKQDDPQPYWIDDNGPLLTLDMFLDKLKPLFNAEWKVKNNTLYFDRHDKYDSEEFIYDFTKNGADRNKIVEGVCYSWNENKKKAYGSFGYSKDGFDNLTQDLEPRFSDRVEFNKPVNPLLEGEKNMVSMDFAMARFRQDGIISDYIGDALKYTAIAIALSLGGAEIILHLFRDIMKAKRYAIIMQNHTVSLPKLIIWDGKSKRGAKAKSWHTFNINVPQPNQIYNPTGITYENNYINDVRYDEYYNENCQLFNYPMAFDADYTGNLYDRFHQIDDPRINPPMNKNFNLKIALCTEDIIKLGLYDNADIQGLGRKVKLDAGTYYKEGKIKEITLNFDPTDKLGRYIEIKGTI